MRHRTFILGLAALSLLLPPAAACAAFFEDTILHVAPQLNAGLGGTEFGGIFLVIMESFIGLANAVGIFMIIRAGLTLTLQQEDNAMQKALTTIRSVAVALIVLNLATRVALAFKNYQTDGISIIQTEALGLLSFFETLAAITAIIFIVVSGIRAVISVGGEDGTTHLKRVVLSVGAGLLLLALKTLVLDAVVGGLTPAESLTPAGVLTAISRVVQIVLGLGALAATVVLIIAGLMMILNIGKEEQYTRAKGLVLRVGIGIIVILTSLAIVRFVIG